MQDFITWNKNEKYVAKKMNNDTFNDYYYRLKNFVINMFEWSNLPETVDERFLELTLCDYGFAVYFNDEEIGNLALTCMIAPPLDVYRIPIKRRAYATNGYQKELDNKNSVMIFNNYLHIPSSLTIYLYAKRLYEIERTIDVNVKAQKTPIAILCEEAERLSLMNLYKNYDGNIPVIFGAKNLDLNNIKSLTTTAPYESDKLNTLKRQYWNEALTFCGIENSNTEKKERLITDEVVSNLGGVQAQRYVMLNARREAAKKINKMFGTNIEVNFRQEFNFFNEDMATTTDNNPTKTEVGEEWQNIQ